MKTVIISLYEAYPPVSGASSVTYNFAKNIVGESFLIQLGEHNSREKTVHNVNVITIQGPADNKLMKIIGFMSRARKTINQILEIKPDIVVLEGASWVLFHWLILRKINFYLPNITVIYHSHNVEYVLRKEKHGSIVTILTKWAEKKVLVNADHTFAVSEVDAENFKRLYDIKPHLLPNGVDIDVFNNVTNSNIKLVSKKYNINNKTILFMGDYAYKPNKEAIDFMLNKIMPNILDLYQDVRFAVIGGDIPQNESWIINPGVISYEDLPVFVKACGICVAPIFSGSGTRLKILECMAAGKAVVATAKGAEGIDIENGKNIVIADSEGKFSGEIINLLQNPEYEEMLGCKGKELIEKKYTWKIIMRNFNSYLQGEVLI